MGGRRLAAGRRTNQWRGSGYDQLARIDAALADAEAEAEESGEAERQRQAYYSRYQAA
jgi:hypothetical protein